MKAGPRAQFLALPKHHVPQEQDWWGWGRGTAQVSPRAPVPTPCPLLTTTTMARIAFAVGLRDSVGVGGCSEGGVGYRPELITCQACLLWSSCPPFVSPAITVSHPSEAQVKLTTPPSLPIRKAGVLDEWSAEALMSSGLQGLGLWFVVVRESGVGSAS